MSHTPISYKRYLLLSGVALTLTLGSIAYALVTDLPLPWKDRGGIEMKESESNGFAIAAGTSREITVHGECKKVTAPTTNVFIPTLTLEEWNKFKAGASGVAASIGSCLVAPLPTGDCSIQWYVKPTGPTNDEDIALGVSKTFGVNIGFTYIGSSLVRAGQKFTCPLVPPPPGVCQPDTVKGYAMCMLVPGATAAKCADPSDPANTCYCKTDVSKTIDIGNTIVCPPATPPPPSSCEWQAKQYLGAINTGRSCDSPMYDSCTFAQSGTISTCNDSLADAYKMQCICGSTGPQIPIGLSATPGNGSVGLSWTAPSGSVTDYIIEYKTTAGATWLVFADGVSTSTTTTVTGLANGVSYDFRIRTKNTAGESRNSAPISSTPYVAGGCNWNTTGPIYIRFDQVNYSSSDPLPACATGNNNQILNSLEGGGLCDANGCSDGFRYTCSCAGPPPPPIPLTCNKTFNQTCAVGGFCDIPAWNNYTDWLKTEFATKGYPDITMSHTGVLNSMGNNYNTMIAGAANFGYKRQKQTFNIGGTDIIIDMKWTGNESNSPGSFEFTIDGSIGGGACGSVAFCNGISQPSAPGGPTSCSGLERKCDPGLWECVSNNWEWENVRCQLICS